MQRNEPDLGTSLLGHGDSKPEKGTGIATPHRSKRVNLGTPASYYFKYMNSGRKNNDTNEFSAYKDESDDETGTISIPALQSSENSKAEMSFFSMAGSSTASEGSGDLLNKSTLSDTTELTASNFVLVTTSKQNMIHRKRNDFMSQGNNKENNQIMIDVEDSIASQSKVEKKTLLKERNDPNPSREEISEKNEKKIFQSNSEATLVKETQAVLHQKKRPSPSLRSRISASPASLRRFHEDLKTSRMKRQQEREESAKRRLSVDANDTLDSINAQLHALSTFNRPKTEKRFSIFTQHSQTTSPASSIATSNAGSTNSDSTATVNMADLDDLLGIKIGPTAPTGESSATTCKSTGQCSVDSGEETSTLELIAKYRIEKSDDEKKPSETSLNKGFGAEDRIRSTGRHSLGLDPSYTSPPSTTPTFKLRSVNSGSRKRMTPSKLSSTPQRIVNPHSIFSPASNTRSAKKRRMMLEGEQMICDSSSSILGGTSSKMGTRLFHEVSKTTQDVSTDSDSSSIIAGITKNQSKSPPSRVNNDDTASLGDIADLFDIQEKNTENSKSMDSNDLSDSIDGEDSMKIDGQETASVGDVNDIINKIHASSPWSRNDHSSKISATGADKFEEPHKQDTLSSRETSSLQADDDRASARTSHSSGLSLELEPGNDSSSNNKENIELKRHSSPSTPPTLSMPSTPQRVETLENDHQPESSDRTPATEFPKSPLRLTPNNHKKPTPTKLAPTPRRVINPMNPHSPARNTRSATKKLSGNDTSSLNSAQEEEISMESSFAVELRKHPTNHDLSENEPRGVTHSSIRWKSSDTMDTNDTKSPESRQPPKHPVGILSSKKKGFPRRSVAFGSPEAAEYNIGSPSVSLTPMPKGRAKALFSLPMAFHSSRNNPSGSETNGKDLTINESGMNMILVDKMTVEQMKDSPELSPIEKRRTDTDMFHVPSNLMSTQNSCHPQDATVELETGMDGLIANNQIRSKAFTSPERKCSEMESPNENGDNSIELTDSESIASIHSKCEKYTAELIIPIDAQRLDFSFTSEPSKTSDVSVDMNNVKTVQLEDNMVSILKVANQSKSSKELEIALNMNSSQEGSSLTAGISEVAVMQSRRSRSSGTFAKLHETSTREDGKTVELEGDMCSLLNIVGSSESNEGNRSIKMSADSERRTDDDITEEFTGNLRSARKHRIIDVGETVGETVELEGNMSSLLRGTDEQKPKNDTMESSFDTSRMSIDYDNSQHFTANLNGIGNDKRFETGNAFEDVVSLAQQRGSESKDRSIIEERMVTSSDSVSLLTNDEFSQIRNGNTTKNEDLEAATTIQLEGNMLSLLENAQRASSAMIESKEDHDIKMGAGNAKFTGSLSIGELLNTNLDHKVEEKDEESTPENELQPCVNDNDTAAGSVSLARSPEIDVQNSLNHCEKRSLRRKSLSSNSFILDNSDSVQIMLEDTANKNKSVSFSDTTEFIRAMNTDSISHGSDRRDPSTIDVPALISILFDGLQVQKMNVDGLCSSFSRFGKPDEPIGKIVQERWGQFIEAVCGEVERRIDQEGTASSSLKTLVEEDPDYFSIIQQTFQSKEKGPLIKTSLKNLTEAAHALIQYEWNSWLATVLDSFHGPLSDIPQMFSIDGSKLDEALQFCENVDIDISLLNDQKTKRARRRSLNRYNTLLTNLEGEIQGIESRLSLIKVELQELESEEINISEATSNCQDILSDASKYNDLKVSAESSQKSYLSLRGLQSWSMGEISPEKLEFFTLGSCPQTNMNLLYKGTHLGKAQESLTTVSLPRNRKPSCVYVGPIANFLDTSTKRLIKSSKQSSEGKPIEIREHLQKHTWLTGRLDLIAKEFLGVQRRYRGRLSRNNEESFSVVVEFESELSSVVADFTITSLYPSLPVEVRLDLISGEQELEVIRRTLVKNARPGFGSLLRACDIIQSIILN